MSRMDQTLVTRIVEAALLAANQPLTVIQLNGLFPLDEPAPEGSVQAALEQLQQGCNDRGVELVESASGWRFQVQADVHPWVARLWTERQTKYTRATLETLALIAYRQPITRGEIEQVRGVAVSSNIIKALEEREWIRVVGHRDVPGKPELLATTKAFLDYFGLKRLDQLPPLSELKDIGELEPQLPFAPSIPAAIGVEAESEMVSGTISPDAVDNADENQSEIVPDTISADQQDEVDEQVAPNEDDAVDNTQPANIETGDDHDRGIVNDATEAHADDAGNAAASDSHDPQRDDARPASSEHTNEQ